MYWRHITLVSAATLIFASSAAAQPAGTLEFGAYGAYTSFGELALFDDAYGGGGRLGFFLLPRLEIEGAATYTVTQEPTGLAGDISYMPIRASLLYNQPSPSRSPSEATEMPKKSKSSSMPVKVPSVSLIF